MRRVLKKSQSQNFAIKSSIATEKLVVDADKIGDVDDNKISVNLRYYDENFECFSKWQKDELKKFTKWLKKMSSRTTRQVREDTNICHRHVGTPKKIPKYLSPDIAIYNIHIGNKERVHGFFGSDDKSFYLIWLDRSHQICK